MKIGNAKKRERKRKSEEMVSGFALLLTAPRSKGSHSLPSLAITAGSDGHFSVYVRALFLALFLCDQVCEFARQPSCVCVCLFRKPAPREKERVNYSM